MRARPLLSALLLLALAALTACYGNDRTARERLRDAVDPPSGPLERVGRATERAINRLSPR